MQLERAGGHPDVAIGCTGGGSDFAGLAFPFIGKKLREGLKTRILAVEPMTCPSLTKGVYAYDFGDTVGMSPLVSQLHDEGVIDARLSPDSDLPGSCAVRARRGHRSRAGLRASR